MNGEGGPASASVVVDSNNQITATARSEFNTVAQYATGIMYCGSMIAMSDISDGTSNTYLVGEKYLDADAYQTGSDVGDNESAFAGDNEDLGRWTASAGYNGANTTYLPPFQDVPGGSYRWGFGSAHANGFQIAFCDGSVQMLSYTIDPEVHRCLGNRKDGKAIDGKKFVAYGISATDNGAPMMDRRQFLAGVARTAPALALGAAMLRPSRGDSPSPSPGPGYTLPGHLPKKLSIGMFQHGWITMATPGEPYYDLEQAVAGLPERGFNSVRVETGLNWCFHADGTPRGEMEFGSLFPVYHDHLIGSAKGGGRHDVLKRVIQLLQLARKYGVYVVLTSWEYQDTNSLVADPKIRAEVTAVPESQRFMRLARHHDRLLHILKDQGLHKNIAYIEVHNEPDASQFPQGAEGKRLHQEAIAFLRDRHGDVLVERGLLLPRSVRRARQRPGLRPARLRGAVYDGPLSADRVAQGFRPGQSQEERAICGGC